MKLKLDLHTHCHEATGLRPLTTEIVETLVRIIKDRGLNGIAITEHYDTDYAYKVKEIVEQHFNNEVIIIPGQEVYRQSWDEVELYLPGNYTFRFLAHPGFPSHPFWPNYPKQFPQPGMFDNVQGIEIENWMHKWSIDREKVEQVAEEHGLLLLRNSDAHYLDDIGKYYNEIDLEELYARAQKTDSQGKEK